jgi:glycerol-3-phosphate dehydrogenase
MNAYDIVIIGGGIVGMSIARELSRYQLRIALLEKEEEPGFGVSKANSGIIHPGTQNPPHSLKGKLCVQGNRLTKEICKKLDVEFKEVGELVIAFNEQETESLLQLKKEGEILGVPRLEIVNSDWLRANEPNLNKDAVAGLFAPTAGVVSPFRLVYALAENALRNGVEIHTQTLVQSIIPLMTHNPNGKERFEITTSKGVFKTEYLINAAGLFADEISGMAGIDDIKIRPRKGQEFLLDKKSEHLTNHVIFPLPTKTSKGILIIKTSDGNPMIGPTAHDVDNKYDLSTSEDGLKEVFTSAAKLIPSISRNDIIAYFAGLRPVAGNDFIIRHEEKVPGFINVAGIQSPGLTSASAIAVYVSELLKNNGLPVKTKQVFHDSEPKHTQLFTLPLSSVKEAIKKNTSYGDIVCRCEMVSAGEVRDAIKHGARTLDGIKFRTRAQAGRCHGSFCTTRLMKILSEETNKTKTDITKRGQGSEIVKEDRNDTQ